MAAAVRVDKATNELLLGPDWTLNIDICDAVNSDHGQAKEVIKALKKRIQHKNANVQFLALTLLETLIKNCGDRVHVQVIERNILDEMMKIVKKKADMQVRDKILTLLDSWQEAFGGPGGKHPHYYWAYAELKRAGVEFPKRSPDAAPVFTPPVTRPASLPSYLQAGYGMQVDSSLTLDEVMSSNGASLSMPDLERMLGAAELLGEMLRAVDPNDHDAVNDEIITELVNQCRSDQKKILSLVSSLRDEELLGQALDLNDKLQILLEKHDAMASGSPLPAEVTDVVSELPAGTTPNLGEKVAPTAAVTPTMVSTNVLNDEEEEDEDDEFSLLARRNSRFRPTNSESASPSLGTYSSTIHEGTSSSAASVPSTTSYVPSNALSLPDPPAPVRTSPEDQVMSDLLALTISSNPSPPYTPITPEPALNQGGSTASHPQPYNVNQGHATANYVAPWAQPQSQAAGIQQQTPSQSQLPYNSLAYPPPPWASQDSMESNPFVVSSSQHQSSSNSPINVPPNLRPLQQSQSFAVPLRTASLDSPINGNLKQPLSAGARRPSYVSSNKFFDDLFERNSDGSLKVGGTVGSGTSSPYKA
ncbi:hypothetical protein SETIT_3G282900v2 [Setaria italica]|uniref:VHS domain-containing protein n=1 Tax=Setaria italica TaxID=4555 RepID=K3Z4V2_SETIT|nr:TOM1-like protein 6 [Setaria italica]RCV18226.1 hypothetical protein SETIT_3G282900v2 [Setaria italica]